MSIEKSKYLGQFKTFVSPYAQDIIEGITPDDQDNIIFNISETKVQHIQFAVDYMFKALKFYNGKIKMPKFFV